MKWISVNDSVPNKQIECVFFAKPFEWRTGMYTPEGWTTPSSSKSDGMFEYHQHWGDDKYHVVSCVTHWMPLPDPPKSEQGDSKNSPAAPFQQTQPSISTLALQWQKDKNPLPAEIEVVCQFIDYALKQQAGA